MREIKFRAWDKEEKAFLGNDFDLEIGRSGEMIIKIYYEDVKGSVGYPDCILQQFTGLKDKNGKEIYEGDILQSYPIKDVRFVVGFGESKDNGTIGFLVESLRDDHTYSLDNSVCKMEVIGNIYENPELLKGEKEEK